MKPDELQDLKVRLKKFLPSLQEAKERSLNEADTRLKVINFLDRVLGYDSNTDITLEQAVSGKFVDIGVKIKDAFRCFIEVKSIDTTLRDTHLYQAMNYAATQGIRWCVLTNGTDWQVYRIDWSQSGVSKELLLDIRLLEENLDVIVDKLQYLAKKSLARDEIEEYWIKHQALSVSQVLTALFSERVFDALRKELKGLTDYNPSYEELARSLKQALSEEALELAADLKLPKKAKPKAERKAVEPEEEGGKEESGEEPKIISRIQEETQE